MSSHHFVKEKQEPALIIETLAAFDQEYLGQLLEWNPIILCSERSYPELDSRGIKVDIVFSSSQMTEVYQSDLKMEPYQGSFIDVALQYLLKYQYPAVNIIGDSLSMERLLSYATAINLILYQDGRRSFMVKSGFSKWEPANAIIRIKDIPALEIEGLEKTEPETYRKQHDGFYRIRFNQDYVFISEEI